MIYTEEFKNKVREYHSTNPFGLFDMLERNDFIVGIMLRELDYDSGLYDLWREENITKDDEKEEYERDRVPSDSTAMGE